MMKQFKLKLIVLLVVVISTVHLKCWALNASPSQLQQQQQQRHVGQLAPKNSSSVDRIAAILAAKPRSTGSAAKVQSSDQQQTAKQSKANQPTSLHSEASTVDRKSVSELTTGAIKNQGKRQTGDFADQTRPSRRNEDAWFLDQAPLPLQPYRFVYNVKDKNGLTEQYRQETGDGKFLTGSYGYVLPDGIFRHVDYVADDRGFRAFIRTSEPGTANQNPADVVINSSPVPGVNYATNPTVISTNTAGSQSTSLFGTQPQTSWLDQQQQPRAAWNYSTLGPSQFGPIQDRVKSGLDGSGILARRAPGSIVNTPARNFSSFTYPFAPLEPRPPPASSYLNTQDSPSTGNFQSLARFGDLARLNPIGGRVSDSVATSRNLTNFNTLSADQFNTHLTDAKLDRERDQTSSGLLNRISPSSGTSSQGSRFQSGPDRSNFYVQSAYQQRPGLLLPSRVGPDVLLYDRPFGVQQVAGDLSGSNKLTYDYNHILSRDPTSFQAEERAKSLAYLDQLKLLARNFARPDLTPDELGTLSPISGSNRLQLNGGPTNQFSGNSGETTTKTTSSSHSEHHHEHKSTSQIFDDQNKVTTLSREHKTGSSSGSGHDSGSSSRLSAEEQTLTPPPQPRFTSGQRWTPPTPPTKGGQQQFARLLAPYADDHQFGRKGGVKGAQEQSQQVADDVQRQQQATISSPAPPEEPRAPVEPSSPSLSDNEQTRQTSSASPMRTTPVDEIDLNQATASKSAPQTMRPTNDQHPVRSVRMPEDYRTSLLMNDLRSMQNAIGLPQPPRLQRSSSLDGGVSLGDQRPSNSAGSVNLGEQIVLARMNRVEALLGGTNGGSGGPGSAQQASVQQSVAVKADKRKLDDAKLQETSNKLERAANLLATLNRPAANEIDDDQPRRHSTGPLLKHAGEPSHGGHHQSINGASQGNETAMFEAQRLGSNKARLRADKVSELEKFQQRLRTQQLLLEQIKSNEIKANSLATRQPKPNATFRVNEANSHVKYDEPHETELLSLIGNANKDNEPARSRRQNDLESSVANRTSLPKRADGSSNLLQSTTTTRAPAESDFARQLHRWPSISGLERQRTTGVTSNNNSSNSNEIATSGPVAFKAHKMDSQKQASSSNQDGLANFVRSIENTNNTSGTNANGAYNGTQRNSPNTINLDFINSVTALSMDELNPFAISSVNPAVQRNNGASSERLSPHRLAMPLASVQQVPSSGGANLLATAPARYFSSPELLAALNHHERHETSQQLRNLISQNQIGPANHRTSSSASANGSNAPYMMQPQEQATNTRSLEGILGAKFTVTPSSATSVMSEAANSQHKSIVPTPRPPTELDIRQARSKSQASGIVQKDGFEIRDRAVQADNHRFYEVVSSLKHPAEAAASFQAFRDAQLSIPVNSRR